MEECAICFEPTAERETLPCACNICYCSACWDKACASSVRDQQRARCPTCRGPVRVDYDADTCKLKFSKGDDEDPGDMIERIAAQARPRQIRILEQYAQDNADILRPCAIDTWANCRGLSISALKAHISELGLSSEGCLEKADLIHRVQTSVVDGKKLTSWLASLKVSSSLQCVCGSALKRISRKSRVAKMIKGSFPHLDEASTEFARACDQMLDNYACICDLCDEGIPPGVGVWTCENGTGTILHATDYDVCDVCFNKHVTSCFQEDTDSSGVAEAQRILEGLSKAKGSASSAAGYSDSDVKLDDADGRKVTCPLCKLEFVARSEEECTKHMMECPAFSAIHGVT